MRGRQTSPSRLACMRTMRVLQSYLDGTLGSVPAQRVAEHLEECRRCGLEASVYSEIKEALSRQDHGVEPRALERLRRFGERLSSGEQPVGD